MTYGARVFISCGQACDEERQIARDVSQRLRALGFEPYVATEEQTLRGLKENIFGQLAQSEYMVFIDFRRERIGESTECRASLFSNQELAIAAFREIEVLALREDGVKLDGISRFMQENALPFKDRRHLASVVADKICERRWKATWRNELSLIDKAPAFERATRVAIDGTSRGCASFYQIYVTNRHRDKPAINCYAYLESILDTANGQASKLSTIEHKWAGYIQPNALIAAGTSRAFDAFHIYDYPVRVSGANSVLQFNVFADSSQYYPSVPHAGEYRFTYRVVAENFPSVTGEFHVVVSTDPWSVDIRFA